jgi:hypothetical protein
MADQATSAASAGFLIEESERDRHAPGARAMPRRQPGFG